ncbi:MAG: hypothetical protein PHX78_08375 [bacterium]|nr:hypothetical protein [bacterium]
MADIIGKKDLSVLIKESWGFFAKRWVILFQISLFVWIPAVMILPLVSFLWTSYNSLKTNTELLFSVKVILAGGILTLTVFGILALVLLMDKLMKVTIMDKLWEKPEEKYYLELIKLTKEVWPKMGALCNAQLLVWVIVFAGCLLLFAPGVLFLIWFSFVPYEVILKGKTGKDALSSSKKIVRQDLAKFVGNMLVMIGILVFINIGLTGFFKLIFSKSTTLLAFGELAATIISNVLSLWLTVFHFGLYKELGKRV